MVRIVVALALAAAVEGVRTNVKEADLAKEEADAALEDVDFDYEVADGLDWDEDEELAAGDFNFEEGDEELATGDFNFEEGSALLEGAVDAESNETQVGSWQCVPGQGGAGQSIQSLPYNNLQHCASACAHSHQCDAFDFTTWGNRDACRFYRANNRARINDQGLHSRQYCYHTRQWLNSHPNWHQNWRNSHQNWQAPQGYGQYGVQAGGFGAGGNFFVADGCRRSQRNENAQIRSSLNGFASVRCCSNNGRRCESTSIGCLQHQTMAQATAACARRNMRLCSVQELDSGVCCGTGCGFDGHHVWTMTPAGGGYGGGGMVIPQNNGFRGNSEFVVADGCSRNQGRQNARTRNAFNGRSSVRCCSMNGRRCETQTTGCLQGVSFDQANAACSQRGLRLCSQHELERGVCCGTGCGFDGRRVWTSTPAR